jgi:hypothetical protein
MSQEATAPKPENPDPTTAGGGRRPSSCSAVGATHHHACACREEAMLKILILAEPIMEAWAKAHELDEWHCCVEDLIGTAYPSFMNLPNDGTLAAARGGPNQT